MAAAHDYKPAPYSTPPYRITSPVRIPPMNVRGMHRSRFLAAVSTIREPSPTALSRKHRNGSSAPEPADPAEILRSVAARHGISVRLLRQRFPATRKLTDARQEAMWRLSSEALMEYRAIGKMLGGRSPASVLYGCTAHLKRTTAAGK